jgi:hypothetical protein
MSRSVFTVVTALSLSLALIPNLASAKPSDADVAGALLLLGTAALLHHENHYQGGYEPKGKQEVADFERGYRDGLHNAEYDRRNSERAYGEGFSAGMKERENQLSHRNGANHDGTVPVVALKGCVGHVAGLYNTRPDRVHVVKSRQAKGDEFVVEVAYGHDHFTCRMGAKGNVRDVRAGQMQ